MVAPLMLAKYVNLAFGKGVGNNTDSNMDGSSTIYRRRTYFKLSVVFLSIRVNLVKKYIRSVTSSASIVLCAFIRLPTYTLQNRYTTTLLAMPRPFPPLSKAVSMDNQDSSYLTLPTSVMPDYSSFHNSSQARS